MGGAHDSRVYFGVVDYILFGATLVLSSVIGIYLAIKHRKASSSAEYLLASRSLPWFPIFVSLVASFFSAVAVMGFPAQVYSTGVTFSLHTVCFLLPICLCAEVLTPMFRNLSVISVNEYLELRYSTGVRYLGCFFFHLQYLLYLSIVLYAPSLALYSVAKVPLPLTIITTGVVCTFYTSLGGMRAVIWTDVFQSFVMTAGLLVTAVVGVMQVGSLSDVFKPAAEMDRLSLNFSLDPTEMHTVWGCSIGLTFSILSTWTISQPTIQRVVAAKSEKDAKRALYMSFVGIVVIIVLIVLDAFVIYAVYWECDLVYSKEIMQNDQILPYFVVNKLGRIPGIAGLFTACIYSFALSTISSGLNGMSAMFLEDVVKKISVDMSSEWQLRISRLIACLAGIFVTGFAFVVPQLGKYVLKLVLQFFGIIGGPYFALFMLGIFTETANSVGASVGSVCGLCIGLFFSIGQLVCPPSVHLPPISIRGCASFNATLTNSTGIIYPHHPQNNCMEPVASILRISYTWHGMISILSAIVIGYLVSSCTAKPSENQLDKSLLYNWKKNFVYKRIFRGEVAEYEMHEKGASISYSTSTINS